MAALTPEDLAIHADFLRRLAMRLLQSPDLAEDAVQETMVLAWTKQPDVESHRGWLAGALKNVARNLRRGERRRAAHENVARERSARSPAAILEREETRSKLLAAILALPEGERDVILLRYDEGLPPRKVAAALDVPVHTVHNRIRSALARLRAELDEAYGGDDRSWRRALVAFVPALPTSAGGTTLGGLLVGKKIALAAAAVLIALAAWYVFDSQRSDLPHDTSQPMGGASVEVADDDVVDETPGLTARPSNGDAEPSDTPDATARVHGRIVDPETGEPVAGAKITAFDYERLDVVTTETDADGRFEIPNSRERSGAFHLVVDHDDHARNVLSGVTASADGMTIVRRAGGFIEGRLVDVGGAPVSGYQVHAIARLFQPGEEYDGSAVMAGVVLPEPLTIDASAEVSDPSGAFRVGPLLAGVHVLVFQVDGHPPLFEAEGAAYYDNHEGIEVQADQTTSVGDVRLPQLGHLELMVIDSESETVLEDIVVVAEVGVNGRRYEGPVDVDGRARDGAYVIPVALRENGTIDNTELRVSKPGYSVKDLSISGYGNGSRLTMRLERTASLRATVLTPAGDPAANDTVIVRRDSDRVMLSRAALDGQGRFAADDLPAGEHLEVVVLDSTTLQVLQVFPLALSPGEVRELTLGGPNQTALAGVVTIRGEPVRALVSLDTPSGRRVQVQTDADGRFRYDALESGSHGIGISSSAPQVFLQRALTTVEGKVLTLEIRLDHSIRGTTSWTNPDENDSGLGNPSLIARPVEGDGFHLSSRVKNNGTFEIPVPEATTYEIGSEFSDFLVPDRPRIDPSRDDEPITVRLIEDPRDGTATFPIVDARTGEPVMDASYSYRSRETSGGGVAIDGVITDGGLPLGTHNYVFLSPDHVEQALTVEVTETAKVVEQEVRLVPSGGVRVVGFSATSRARDAGVQVGDVIVDYGDARVRSVRALVAAIQETASTDAVSIALLREDKRVVLDIPGGRMGVQVVNAPVPE